MDQKHIGSIVRSLCGRDRKRIYLITGISCEEKGIVLICDGRLHPLSKPKKKNLRHLAVLAAADSAVTSFSEWEDEKLWDYLQGFEEGLKG